MDVGDKHQKISFVSAWLEREEAGNAIRGEILYRFARYACDAETDGSRSFFRRDDARWEDKSGRTESPRGNFRRIKARAPELLGATFSPCEGCF